MQVIEIALCTNVYECMIQSLWGKCIRKDLENVFEIGRYDDDDDDDDEDQSVDSMKVPLPTICLNASVHFGPVLVQSEVALITYLPR